MTTANPPSTTISVQSIIEPIQAHLPQVKTAIQNIVPPESQLLAESLHYTLSEPGKQLRPALTLLMAGLAGGIQPNHIDAAAVSEMIHTATLLHDDVLDDAELRRKKPTNRMHWGNTVSILSGDYLLAQASRKLAAIGNIRVVAIFSDVLADLCDGEVEQIRQSYILADAEQPTPVNWDSYYRKTICKTASLFQASCEAAGVLNHQDERTIQAMVAYGRHLGIAFQIVDDLLDYTATAEQLGKPVMDDLRNGLMNAPILLLLESESLSVDHRKQLVQSIRVLFEAPESPTAVETAAIEQAIAVIRQQLNDYDMINATMALAQQHIDKALNGLSELPDSSFKAALADLGQYAIQRKY